MMGINPMGHNDILESYDIIDFSYVMKPWDWLRRPNLLISSFK